MEKRVIFDFDGTLIKHDFSYEYGYFNSCLSSKDANSFIPNIGKLLAFYESTYEKYDSEMLRKYFCDVTGIDFTPDMIKGWRDVISTSKNEIIDGVPDVLDYFKSKDYSLVILTNWFSEDQIARLKGVGLFDYFDEIIGGEVALKPSLRSYKCATGRFSPNDCVMIGDNYKNDVLGAINAGIDGIYFDEQNKDNENKVYTKKITNIGQLKEMY